MEFIIIYQTIMAPFQPPLPNPFHIQVKSKMPKKYKIKVSSPKNIKPSCQFIFHARNHNSIII